MAYSDLDRYDIYVTEALPIDTDALMVRDHIEASRLSPDDRARLDELDEILLDEALSSDGNVTPGLLEDHPDKPIDRWWWHLGAIRRGDYPIETLPEHLQRAIREASA